MKLEHKTVPKETRTFHWISINGEAITNTGQNGIKPSLYAKGLIILVSKILPSLTSLAITNTRQRGIKPSL